MLLNYIGEKLRLSMKNALIKFSFFFLFSTFLTLGQDVSPELKFDESGYVDDLARERAPDMADEKVESNINDLKPVSKTPKKISNVNVGAAQTFQGQSFNVKSKGPSLLLILSIVGVVLLLLIGALAYFFMVKKPKMPIKDEELEDFEKDILHKDDKIVNNDTVEDPSSTVVYSRPSASSDLAAATRIDEFGRNPSGIIVDEDKYFAAGSTGFVDEDLAKS